MPVRRQAPERASQEETTYRTICLIPLLSLLIATQDAAARNAGDPRGTGLAAPPTARKEQAGVRAPAAEEARYYADSFIPLRDDVRAFERDPANRYTYCIRNVATYECLSYASDGTVRRRQHRATAHGTGFAYKLDGDDTRLLTNEHVVSWPFVTDAEHAVEDVPLGCKLASQKLSIIDNEDDEYEADDIPLTRLLDDRALDVAVVRAKGKLALMPYRIGKSSELSAGDVVIVRGSPLGVRRVRKPPPRSAEIQRRDPQDADGISEEVRKAHQALDLLLRKAQRGEQGVRRGVTVFGTSADPVRARLDRLGEPTVHRPASAHRSAQQAYTCRTAAVRETSSQPSLRRS